MMGAPVGRQERLFYEFDLEEMVPADHLLRAIGCEVSARGVAGLYREIADAFLLDRVDEGQLPEIEAMGLRAAARDTLMVDRSASARVARAALELIGAAP